MKLKIIIGLVVLVVVIGLVWARSRPVAAPVNLTVGENEASTT